MLFNTTFRMLKRLRPRSDDTKKQRELNKFSLQYNTMHLIHQLTNRNDTEFEWRDAVEEALVDHGEHRQVALVANGEHEALVLLRVVGLPDSDFGAATESIDLYINEHSFNSQ